MAIKTISESQIVHMTLYETVCQTIDIVLLILYYTAVCLLVITSALFFRYSKTSKSSKTTCDLCCDVLKQDRTTVTTKHYTELTTSSSTYSNMFVCQYCCLKLFKSMVSQLQSDINTPKTELNKVTISVRDHKKEQLITISESGAST